MVSVARTAGLVVAGCCSAVAGVIGAYAFADEAAVQSVPTATPVEVTRAAIARELASATATGFPPAADVSASARAVGAGGPLQLTVNLAARECVAVIAGVSGFQRLTALTLAAPGPAGTITEAAVDHPEGAAGQVQYCATQAMTVVVSAQTTRRSHERPPRYTESSATVLLTRAPWSTTGGFSGLRRGRFDSTAVAFAGRGAEWDELTAQQPAGATLAWPEAMIDRAHAAVAPSATAVVTWFATLSARGTGSPMGHPRIAWDPTAPSLEAVLPTSLAAHDPVVDIGFNDYRRVLLALDPAATGPGCTTVLLTRARYRTRPQVWRWTGQGAPAALTESGNVARDVVCGGGQRLYLVGDDNGDAYRVQAWR